MKAAVLFYVILLLLEGMLAWLLTGQGFLMVAVNCGLVVFSVLRKSSRPIAEGTRLFTAAALAVAGPLQYQNALGPLLLCFVAVPHFLAATQALSELQSDVPQNGNPRMRTLVFTIAFYTSMGLVLLLARGFAPAMERATTSLLAVLVLVLGLAAWDASRIARLKNASLTNPPTLRRWALPALLLALAALIYSGPLPYAADWLCRLSPHWSMDPVEFKNKPPKPPPTEPEARPADEARDTGTDESAVTGQHRLPPKSDLQPTETPRFCLVTDPPATAQEMLARGPLYLRSHTLNRFSDNKWSAEVTGGVWVDDAKDGLADGKITFQTPPEDLPRVLYDVYAFGSDGYTTATLPGLTEIFLPKVYVVPGDVLQNTATGNIRYRAASSPAILQNLPNPALLLAGDPGDRIHLQTIPGNTGAQVKKLAANIFANIDSLADRVAALQAFMAQHYSYNTVMKNPHSLGALENFMFDERQGHCDFYATSAAVILREGGIPTRIAYGFASKEIDPAQNTVIFRDRNAHAWTEIFIKDRGWTICDFTPAQNIGEPDPQATPPPPPPAPDLQKFADAAKETAPPPPKPETELPLFAKLLAWFQQQNWVSPAIKNAPVVLLVLTLFYALFKYLRRPRTASAAEAAKARAALDIQPPYFMEFLRISEAAGHPKPDGRTPMEHFRALDHAGLPVPPLRPLISYHCATRYEDAPRDPEQENEFAAPLQTFAEQTAPAPALDAAPAKPRRGRK
ncbi:MAG: conserved rane protein of unknown function, Transglutaminase-like [Verrucomicrobiales bacterium]|nr:conserved rane protein of unknown function, Transglutaminase-like [Verrucomicrobiales bacterium]